MRILILITMLALCPGLVFSAQSLDNILSFDKQATAPGAKHLSGAGTADDPAIYHKQAKPLHGNFKTLKYHNEFCDHYNCRTCTKIFRTKAAAEKAGYVPCGKCGG